MKKEKTFMGIPLDRFADADCYVGRRIINGDRPKCTYPQNGIPRTKVKSGHAPTSANVFRFSNSQKAS